MNSLPEPLEGVWPCQHIGFRTSDVGRRDVAVVLPEKGLKVLGSRVKGLGVSGSLH